MMSLISLISLEQTQYITLLSNSHHLDFFSLFYLRPQTLADGNKVNFAGFGTFEPRYRKARKGRNPKTGEEIDIAASVGAGFSAAKALKEKLNDK